MEALKALMEDFDPAAIMPDLSTFLGKLEVGMRVAVMAAPLVLLGLGLLYFLSAPKEANYKLGYRFFWGMSSVEAWQFTQRLAGIVWCVLGLTLCIVMAVLSGKFRGDGYGGPEPTGQKVPAFPPVTHPDGRPGLFHIGVVCVPGEHSGAGFPLG